MTDDHSAPWPALFTAASLMVIAVLVVVVPLQASSTFVTDITQLAAFCLVFAGLWLLTHRMGLLSVGHGALTGVGAYAALHAVNDFGLPPMLMPLAGFAAGCAVGALLGVPALRLPKAYLALLTLSAAVAFPIVLRQLDGPLPVTLDSEFIPPAWTGIATNDEHIWEFWIVVAWVAVAFWLLHVLLTGPIGRALVATRDESTAAAAFGVSVYRLRLAGVSLSSGLAGLAGGLMLVPVNFNDQSLYPEELSIKLFALTIAFGSTAIGGSRLIMTVPAAAVLVLLPVWLVDRPGWVTQGGWIGFLKSEFFLYAVLLLVAAYARSRRSQAVRVYDA
ncbi:branched-chain amino acid ABC transporter permease [Candidatus Poriferisodalis sp.]|uniref:branched-chain amino acid ABC transporter permease n=1 Tax=Candidatus Poriferisodalis sp. TaxID=3101277 RepID=UPI003B025357